MNISTHSEKLQDHQPHEQQSKLSLKIEMMRQSVAQLSVASKGKTLSNVNRFQKQYQETSQMVSQQQRRLAMQIQALQRTILQIQRERIVKQASISNAQGRVSEIIKKAEEDSREIAQRNHQKYQEFRDQITELKIKLTELQIVSQEKAQKIQRQSQARLNVSSQEVQSLNNSQNHGFDKQFGEIRSLNKLLDEQGRKKQKDRLRIQGLITSLQHSIKEAVKQQQKKQKQSFQQNYKALQELFVFLSQQYGLNP